MPDLSDKAEKMKARNIRRASAGMLFTLIGLLALGPAIADAADAAASCRIDPAVPILEKGDSFGINVSFLNFTAYPVTFTVTTKKSMFFGSDDTTAVRRIGGNLGATQFMEVSTANVLQTGRGPLVVEVTSSATGTTILAQCSAQLSVYSPTEVTVPVVGNSVAFDGDCDAAE